VGSIYAQPGATSGSVYAKAGSDGSTAAPAQKGGGGILGSLGRLGHFVAQKAELAGHDLKAMPGGIVAVNEALVHDIAHGPGSPFAKPGAKSHLLPIAEGMGKQTVQSVEHPLRDPFATALTVLPATHGLGKAADIAGVVSHEPRLISMGDAKVPLYASKNPAVRLVQQGYDKIIQKALDTQAANAKTGAATGKPTDLLARHAAKRVGGSLSETARRQHAMAGSTANLVESQAKQLSPLGGHVPGTGGVRMRKLEEAALRLTSENNTPAEAAQFHLRQAGEGVSPKQNTQMAKLYQALHAKGWLTQDEQGNVIVDAAKHPQLAKADAAVAQAQDEADKIAAEHGLMTPEGLQARINGPARIRAGGHFNDAAAPAAAKESAQLEQAGQLSLAPRTPGEAVGSGIVGGETARPGRGYVSHQTESGKLPGGHIASSPGPVIGEAKSYISKTKRFTGKNLRSGIVPDNTSQLVADQLHRAVRYSNTAKFRDAVAKTGSDLKRSDREVLIRLPGETQNPAEVRAAAGKAESTLNTIPEPESNPGSLRDHIENLVPGLKDSFAEDEAQAVGAKAPAGTKWVDRKVLGDMGELAPQVDHFAGKLANRINSAVTAATVYFKPGHVATRVLTNASANVLQGSGGPLGIARSVRLWHDLSPEEQQKALLGAGQHSFQALPAKGEDVVARTARTGAKWWATHADAPFRFNSIAYEARKAGFDTTDKFREFLHQAETGETSDGKQLNAAQHAKVDWVGKRANREAIAYDRLNHFEKRVVTKLFWFYPWTKGATQFLGNTLLEHPYKSGALGAAGVQGREQQANELGQVPSYEFGLIPLGGGSRPESTDFSTFSPFSTPGDLASLPAVGALADQLNPAYGAAVQFATRTNQYGQRSKNPVGDAVSQLFSPTPEAQILSAYQGRHQDQSQRMFEKTWLSQLERALGGPSLPRRVNKSALAKAAAREKSGR
jgi:hypothetical protein